MLRVPTIADNHTEGTESMALDLIWSNHARITDRSDGAGHITDND